MAIWPSEPLRPGWRFHPSDQEIISHFLESKNNGQISEFEDIPEVDVCKCEPWDIPFKSSIKSDEVWFFFSPCERKYRNGSRKNRMTKTGYWKATGRDRKIKSKSSKLIGKKRTLVFYRGHAPNGEKTNWVIHEYQATENDVAGEKSMDGAFVLCRLKKKIIDVERNNVTHTTTASFPGDTQAGDAAEQFGTPLNQGILNSDMQAERLVADELDDGTLYPPIQEDRQCISHMTNGVDVLEAEATVTEVEALVRSFKSLDHPQCLSPSDYNMLIGLGHPCTHLPFNDNFGTGQQMGLELDCPAELMYSFLNDDHIECFSEESTLEINSISSIQNEQTDFETNVGRICYLYSKDTSDLLQRAADGSSSDADSELAVLHVGRRDEDMYGRRKRVLDVSSTNSSHNLFTNRKESSSLKSLTNKSNGLDGTGIKMRVPQPEFSTNDCRVASQPKGIASRRAWLQKKSRGQSVSKKVRELSKDAEVHEAEALISVGGESDEVSTTRVIGGSGAAGPEEALLVKFSTLHLADKSLKNAFLY